jgi:hypothetical protein
VTPFKSFTRCEDCGCNIPDGEEVEDTRSQGFSGVAPGNTVQRMEVVYLCRACASRANRLWNILIWGFVGIAIFGLTLCLYDWLRGR